MAPDLHVLKAETRGTAVYKNNAVLQLIICRTHCSFLPWGTHKLSWVELHSWCRHATVGSMQVVRREGSIASQYKWKASYMYTKFSNTYVAKVMQVKLISIVHFTEKI